MQNYKKLILLVLVLSIGVLFIGCDGQDVQLPENTDAPSVEEIGDTSSLLSSLDAEQYTEINYGKVEIDESFDFNNISNIIRIDVAEYGSIFITLRPDVAPETVNNLKKLALEGFYEGLTFHRVIKDFMIEGGEQDADGIIHDSEMIYGEFSDNNFTNNLNHKRGVISMSRKNIPDSASSGFFIVTKDAPQLDGRYAAFGYVVSGMEIVDKIQNAEIGANGNPTKPIVIEKITFMIEKEVVK